jgi:hypothetical protein
MGKDNDSMSYEVKTIGETKFVEIVDSETEKTIFKAEISSHGTMEFVEVFDKHGRKIRSLSEIDTVDGFRHLLKVFQIVDKEISNLEKAFVAADK